MPFICSTRLWGKNKSFWGEKKKSGTSLINVEIKTFFRQIKLSCGPTCPPPASSPPQRATAVGDLSLNSQQGGFCTPHWNRPSSSAASDCNHRPTWAFKRARASRGSCSPCKWICAGGSPESAWRSRSHVLLPALFMGSKRWNKFKIFLAEFKKTHSTKNWMIFFFFLNWIWREPTLRWRPFIWHLNCPDYWIEYLIKIFVSAGWILTSCNVVLVISHLWSPVCSSFDCPPDNRR